MLTLYGDKAEFCDGVSRRSFIQAGSLGLASLGLSDVLQLQAASTSADSKRPETSVIFVELAGGPTQFETYDPKPLAPAEYRGPFGAVATNVPGVAFSELMPAQARLLDKLSIVRSVRHNKNSHDPSSQLTQTGYYKRGPKGSPNDMPCFGSIVSKIRGGGETGLPAYVAVPSIMRNGGPAHLGKAHGPFEASGDPNHEDFRVPNLSLTKGLNLDRLDDRRTLLTSLDAQRRMLDAAGSAEALGDFRRQAFDLVSGSGAREAFDMSAEPAGVREQYGRHSVGQSLLLARRLVERGVPCVTVRVTGWDDHKELPNRLGKRAPQYDQGIAALIADLFDRGLQQQVLVVAMGEFGRTPRFNKDAGRDHWGAVMSVLLAGGGLKCGIVGASNRKGEVPVEAPYRPENILAMMYRHLGIDPGGSFDDFAGRPRYILERRGLVTELV